MTWKDLARRVRKFDVAVAWAPVDPRDDPHVREYLAVTRFTINGLYLDFRNYAAAAAQASW